MDNGAICKSHQENAPKNSKEIIVSEAKDKTNQGEIFGKHATRNSDKVQNKFDLPSFKCQVCSYESIWKHAVKRHQQTHYKGQSIVEKKKSKYEQGTCSSTTNNWTILNDHQKLDVTPNIKSKTYVALNKNLPTQRIEQTEDCQNNQHKEEFNKQDIYACNKCTYKTNCRVIFESHKKIHLLNKEKEVFRCHLCSFNSIYRQSLLRHLRNIHEYNFSKEDDLDYIEHTEMLKEKKNLEELLGQSGKNISSVEHATNLQNLIQDGQSLNNNLPDQNSDLVKSQEIMTDFLQNKSPTHFRTTAGNIKKTISKPRRGKYSDVLVKMTTNGLFECEHCTYQTAIRTALVKHQKNHLKNANS